MFRYQAKLEALYTALEERQKERLRSLKEGTGGTVAERVKQVCPPSCHPCCDSEQKGSNPCCTARDIGLDLRRLCPACEHRH